MLSYSFIFPEALTYILPNSIFLDVLLTTIAPGNIVLSPWVPSVNVLLLSKTKVSGYRTRSCVIEDYCRIRGIRSKSGDTQL